MAKKKEINLNKHGDCINAVPYVLGHLTVHGNKPILGDCKHFDGKVLLSGSIVDKEGTICPNFKGK